MTNIHLISHTHWDREWYLTFQQLRIKLVHLVDGLLELLQKDPDFKYFMLDGQTIVLDDYLQIRPEHEAELRSHIQNGRILIGPWHILPDEFLVSPEATIRNLLQGERTARRFGPKMMVGYIPDPFGHIGQMPQILHGFGIQDACLQRGLWEEPAEFWWEAPDGSRVLMAYLRDGYGNAASLPASEPERFVAEVCRLAESLRAHSRLPGGDILLMYGTDHMEPPPDTAAAIAYANRHLGQDRLVHSTLPEYIRSIRSALETSQAELPVVTGELRACQRHPLLPNVLSARMWIKQRNQACETLLEKWAEPFSTFASLIPSLRSGQALHPTSFLSQAWRLLMECHPHDSICGCSIDQVHEEMRPRFDQVEQIGEEITRQSLSGIVNLIDTAFIPTLRSGQALHPSSLSAFVVFNHSSTPRTDVVNLSVELPAHSSGEFEILDETGAVLPHQARGMGSRELVKMVMDRKEMQQATRLIGMVHEGRVAGMVVKDVQLSRQGSLLQVEAVLADHGEPDLEAWDRLESQLDEILNDPSLETFHISAYSPLSSEACFVARQVPGFGYRTFWVRHPSRLEPSTTAPMRLNPIMKTILPLAGQLAGRLEPIRNRLQGRERPPQPPRRHSSQSPYVIENEFFRVEASPQDGTLSILDRRSGAEYRGMNRFVDGGDCGDEYNYAPPAVDLIVDTAQVRRVYVEKGLIQQTLEIELDLSIPGELSADRKGRTTWRVDLPVTTRVSLSAGVARIDISTKVDHGSSDEPRARDHRLRVHFTAPFRVEAALYDGHFEVVRRPITPLQPMQASWIEQPRPEKPQREFTAISDGKLGLAIANRGLPEVEALQNSSGTTEIALTLLRCVGWLSRDDFSTRLGHAGPALPTPGAQMPGKYTFEYSILPYFEDRLPFDEAGSFGTSLRAVNTGLHSGKLPAQASFMKVEPQEFTISAIKAAEDGSGWIVRGYNRGSTPLQVRLAPWRPFERAERVSLAEEREEELGIDTNNVVTIKVEPHQIVTVKFMFRTF